MRCILYDGIQIASFQVEGFALETKSSFEEAPLLNFGTQLIV